MANPADIGALTGAGIAASCVLMLASTFFRRPSIQQWLFGLALGAAAGSFYFLVRNS